MKGFLRNILWATDFSREGQEALAYASLFARKFSAAVTALHVVPDFTPGFYSDLPAVELELTRRMEELKKKALLRLRAAGRQKGLALKKIVIAQGSPAKKIIETAEKERADLIVMGKKGQSMIEKILVGSAATHVLRHSPVPVLVTKRKKKPTRIKKILLPMDFTKEEKAERDYGWKLAKGFGASLTLLYVLELYGHDFRLVNHMFKSALEKFKAKGKEGGRRVGVRREVTKAINAAQGIEDYARTEGFDLIVMATCVGALGRLFLGSTTEKVVAHTDVPVFAIPPKYCE
ncbi:MAG: universal stress protein [Acidobacteriota bacterium]